MNTQINPILNYAISIFEEKFIPSFVIQDPRILKIAAFVFGLLAVAVAAAACLLCRYKFSVELNDEEDQVFDLEETKEVLDLEETKLDLEETKEDENDVSDTDDEEFRISVDPAIADRLFDFPGFFSAIQGLPGKSNGKTKFFSFIPEETNKKIVHCTMDKLFLETWEEQAKQVKAFLKTKFYPFVESVSNSSNEREIIITLKDNAYQLRKEFIELVDLVAAEHARLNNGEIIENFESEKEQLAMLFLLVDQELGAYFRQEPRPNMLHNFEIALIHKHFHEREKDNYSILEVMFKDCKTDGIQECSWEGMKFNFWWDDELVKLIGTFLFLRYSSRYINEIPMRGGSSAPLPDGGYYKESVFRLRLKST